MSCLPQVTQLEVGGAGIQTRADVQGLGSFPTSSCFLGRVRWAARDGPQVPGPQGSPAHAPHPPPQRLPVPALAQQPLGPQEGDLRPLQVVAEAHPLLPPLLQLHGGAPAPQLGLPVAAEVVGG